MFLKYQDDINIGWKKFVKPLDIKKQRNQHFCKNCNDNGYRVKMDYIRNYHEKEKYTMYDVSEYKCPRCEKIYKEKMRIEGKGTLGINSGKEWGGQ
jgi:uncharacterized protein with PIN domain